MKKVVFYMLSIFFFALCTEAIGNDPCEVTTNRVNTFLRNAISYTEIETYQFQIDVKNSQFDALKVRYKEVAKKDTTYKDFKVAGFVFLPLVDAESSCEIADSFIQFKTVGLRVLLVLWKPVKISNVNQPREFKIFGFDNNGKTGGSELSDSYSLPKASSDLPPEYDGYYFDVRYQEEQSPEIYRIDPQQELNILASQEFELVFLDNSSFEDLARGDRFYFNRERNINGEFPPEEWGIRIQRATVSREVEAGKGFRPYRTLTFQPYPIPEFSSDLPITEAVEYSKEGYYCPPYWRDENGQVTAEGQFVSWMTDANLLKSSIEIQQEWSFWIFIILISIFVGVTLSWILRKLSSASDEGLTIQKEEPGVI